MADLAQTQRAALLDAFRRVQRTQAVHHLAHIRWVLRVLVPVPLLAVEDHALVRLAGALQVDARARDLHDRSLVTNTC